MCGRFLRHVQQCARVLGVHGGLTLRLHLSGTMRIKPGLESSDAGPEPRYHAHSVVDLQREGRDGSRLPRVLADFVGQAAGPSVVIVGGLHGNEPAGVTAGREVAAALRGMPLRGRVVFLSGNRQASAAGLRFVRRDLDRGWTEASLTRLCALPTSALGDEDQEQRELADTIYEIERTRRGRLVVVDLHTSSGQSAPFVCFGDTLLNRRLARSLPVTAILGLEEVVDGAMAGYWTDRGHVGIALEAGQHRDPLAVGRHVSALWLFLVAAGTLRPSDVPLFAQHRARLASGSAGCPAVVEVRHRHVSSPGDGFEMAAGFASFTPVTLGQVVARDASGPICAPESGLMLRPRYQGQGDDGYFLVREVRPVWLTVSEWLRKAGAPRLLQHLPGIRRDPARLGHLVVDPKVAFSHVAEVMHLCGFRRRSSPDGQPVFSTHRVQKLRRSRAGRATALPR